MFSLFYFDPTTLVQTGYVLWGMYPDENGARQAAADNGFTFFRIEKGDDTLSTVVFETPH